MGQLVMGRYSVRCRCGKVLGLSEEDALMQCRRFAKMHGSSNPVRTYQCQFNNWHWTSQLEARVSS